MAIDDLFEIASEISIKSDGRAMCFCQRDGLREKTATRRLHGVYHRYRPGIMFDYDFRPRQHVVEQVREIVRCFRVRNTDDMLTHNRNYTLFFVSGATMLTKLSTSRWRLSETSPVL